MEALEKNNFYFNTHYPVYLCVILSLVTSGCTGSRAGGYSNAPIQANAPSSIAASGAAAMAPQIIRYESAVLPGGVYHVVRKGETLFHLSKKYRVPVPNIARANRIQDKNRIQVGSRLFIPGIYEKGTAQVIKEIPLYKNTGHWEYIVVHHTATLEGDMEFITRIHKKRGFGEMGYHFLIDNGTSGRQDGEIEIGTRWYAQINGAHAKDSNMNSKSIGIALVGNFSDQHDVSPQQMASLSYLIHILKSHYRISTSHVIQHKDVPGAATECPGNNFPWNQLVLMIE